MSTALAWMTALREFVRARLEEPQVARRFASAPPPHPIVERLALPPEAERFVWATVAVAIDPLMHAHALLVGGADARRGLAVAAYATMVGLPSAAAIELAAWLNQRPRLVEVGLLAAADDRTVTAATPYAPSPRLVAALLDCDEREALVEHAGGVVGVPSVLRVDAAYAAIQEQLARAFGDDAGLIMLIGAAQRGRRTLAAAAAQARGRAVIQLDLDRLGPRERDAGLAALTREAFLTGAIPLIANAASGGEGGVEQARALGRAIDRMPGVVVVTTDDAALEVPSGRRPRRIEVPPPTAEVRVRHWRDALDGRAHAVHDDELHELALSFPLAVGGINAAVAAAATVTAGPVDRVALGAGVRAALADRFGGMAERVDAAVGWDDVILPPDTRDQLRALVARVRHAYRVFEDWRFPRGTARGGGVAALFTGPPGTGKTTVASLIAHELGRDLYRVDLSQIVSKWVGETEKQLGRVFAAAEAGHAVLLFDEADALFARRTEVKSASDRYANLEVNYLLQRVETWRGITILTTNLDASIDPALRRRLAAHITFWPPEHAERVTLWGRYLTTGAPVADVDLEALADDFPDMSGANIRNAALTAAFLAADGDTSITQELLERAARAEYRSMGRVLGGRA
jgi:SpoVK/Ycf46/Vps4 family AAA+-type ATPase